MIINNPPYTFKEFNECIGLTIYDFSCTDKGVEYKFIKDETGKDIQVIILHDIEPQCGFDRYSLIIKYLDGSLGRWYNSIIFTTRFEKTFEYIYEKCKENDYIEVRFNNDENLTNTK